MRHLYVFLDASTVLPLWPLSSLFEPLSLFVNFILKVSVPTCAFKYQLWSRWLRRDAEIVITPAFKTPPQSAAKLRPLRGRQGGRGGRVDRRYYRTKVCRSFGECVGSSAPLVSPIQ